MAQTNDKRFRPGLGPYSAARAMTVNVHSYGCTVLHTVVEASDRGEARSVQVCRWRDKQQMRQWCRPVTRDSLDLGPEAAVGALALGMHFCGCTIFPTVFIQQ